MEKVLSANETGVFRRDPGRYWVCAIRTLIVGALALLGAGCVSTDEPSPAVSASAPSVAQAASGKEPTQTVYGTTIPAHGKFILVNIPSFELVALQDGVPVLRSRVVVGRPESPTPELLSSMYAIKFNPSWTPTPWMIRNEAAHYIPPGPQNPLGRILFELDNDQLIFLHDTNQKELFARERRAFSHGCVRVEQARQLAAWALGVTGQEIDQMISHGGTYSVPLPDPIPVSLTYSPQFPDKDGQTVLHPDIYPGHVAQGRPPSVRPASAETAHLGCEAAAAG